MFMKPKAALLPMWAVVGLQMMVVLAPAQAQSPATAATAPITAVTRPDPADPKAPHPPESYSSPLQAYQRFAEPAVAPWRETNELVGQRGGWRAYAREASDAGAAQPAVPGASQPTSTPKPAAGGHSGHQMK